MKTKTILLSIMMLVSFAGVSAQTKKDGNKEKVTFNVPMDCGSCKNKIEKNIAFEKGVKSLDVDLEKQTVEVTYDKRKTDVEGLQAAFKKIGFEATVAKPACCPAKKEEGCSKSEKASCCPKKKE